MPTVPEAFNRAIAHQQRGNLSEAERLCTDVLNAEPDYFDAKHLLALVLHQQGRTNRAIDLLKTALAKQPDAAPALCNYALMLQDMNRHEEALASLDRALAIKPGFAEAHNNRGSVLAALGRDTEALLSYDRALAINPRYVEALYNRGITLRKLGRHEEALATYDRLLAVHPGHAETLFRRGMVLADLGRYPEALPSYDRLLAVRSRDPEAFNSRGAALSALKRYSEALADFERALAIRPDYPEALNNRGVALTALKHHEEALASYAKALAIRPDYAEAHYNRAIALDELKRREEALASCDRALAIRPDYPEALNNRGIALDQLGRHEEAVASYDRLLALRPDHVEALNNRGTSLIELERFDAALASYDQALALNADYVECRWNRSLLLVRLGRFESGWREYEWRRRREAWDERHFKGPEWTEASTAKRVLLYAEQGLGDTIQFARFARALAESGREVVLEVQPPLKGLLSSLSGVTVVRKGEPLPPFDAHVPLMSLPHVLGATEADLAARIPYLAADPARTESWRARLPADGSFKVGIAWQGNPAAAGDKGRSIPLRAFAPLGRIPGVSLFGLQKNDGIEQLASLPEGMMVNVLGDDFDRGADAFLDTAAVMMNLDLVVTSDTAIVHLAGALARPVWMPLKPAPDWRWMAQREDTPWYPTARLFRQLRRSCWDDVFARMASELTQLAGRKQTAMHHAGAERPSVGAGSQARSGTALVPISFGELIDKMTILRIKAQRIQEPTKAANIRNELGLLTAARAGFSIAAGDIDKLEAELMRTNETLWEIEDRIRDCEREQDFGPRFVELARRIYRTNDRRAELKRQLNALAGSSIIEEKSYSRY
jgi:tetratricopeptide (TPR) repeat protein